MAVTMLRRIIIGSRPRRTLLRALILAVICIVLFRYILRVSVIEGESMEPTIHNKSLHLLNMLTYKVSGPERGDIVAIKAAGHRVMYMKRVLAVPGETIALEDGVLLIDDVEIPEPYVKYRDKWQMDPKAMAVDEYFVAGDNRGMPMDLHVSGTVKRRYILGSLLW